MDVEVKGEMSEALELCLDDATGATAIGDLDGTNELIFRDVEEGDTDEEKLDEDTSVSSASTVFEDCLPFPVGDEHGHPMQFPPGEHESKHTYQAKKEKPRSRIGLFTERVQYLCSMGLLVFSVVVVTASIFTEQTKATDEFNMHPVLAFVIFWFLIVWLGFMEGGQGALVGLQPIPTALYADSHPKALTNTKLAHRNGNMERFIVGRQFLVVLVIFVTNLMASAIADANVLNMSEVLTEIFLNSGLAIILTTIILGQLTAQVNAANCMLDFINNYFITFTTYVSLGIEYSGLLHCVYLVQIIFARLSGNSVQESNEENKPSRHRNTRQAIFFWSRVIMSVVILGFCFAVTVTALFDEKTRMWTGIPAVVSVVIFFVLMCIVGAMEGIQIALFAVVNMSQEEIAQHKIVHQNCQLAFRGKNLQAFLIGRQICVTLCTFVLARITTLDNGEQDENLWGVSDGVMEFFNTGLLGAIITTIVASLAWRIIASSFPVAFMSNPIMYLIIRLCLLLEASGICSATWVMALVHMKIAGYQPDEEYIGTSEERAAAAAAASTDIQLYKQEQGVQEQHGTTDGIR